MDVQYKRLHVVIHLYITFNLFLNRLIKGFFYYYYSHGTFEPFLYFYFFTIIRSLFLRQFKRYDGTKQLQIIYLRRYIYLLN